MSTQAQAAQSTNAENDRLNFAARWRVLRAQLLRKQGLTIEEIGAAIGCDPGTAYHYLRRDGRTVGRICRKRRAGR